MKYLQYKCVKLQDIFCNFTHKCDVVIIVQLIITETLGITCLYPSSTFAYYLH